MSVLIDPYLLWLSDEREIKRNISVFQSIIRLGTHSDKEKRISIALYKGMIDGIIQRAVIPFPISIDAISDYELRKTIIILNQSFSNMLIKEIESIDIDGCHGEQIFDVNGDNTMVEDSRYFEMLSILLTPCYNPNICIDERIITGDKKEGKQIGESFSLTCRCAHNNYKKDCVFVSIDSFVSKKERALSEIKACRKAISIVDNISATMNDHHNHVTADGKSFSRLDDLSFKSKQVLKCLKPLGLYEIKFGRFFRDYGKRIGNMKIQKVEEYDTSDILCVEYYAETGYTIITSLYFPKHMGRIIKDYFSNNEMTYNNVLDLIEKTE